MFISSVFHSNPNFCHFLFVLCDFTQKMLQSPSGYPESNLLMTSLTQPHLKFKEAGWTIPPSNQSILRLWEHLVGDTDGKAQ